jgi:hypothetical protein
MGNIGGVLHGFPIATLGASNGKLVHLARVVHLAGLDLVYVTTLVGGVIACVAKLVVVILLLLVIQLMLVLVLIILK